MAQLGGDLRASRLRRRVLQRELGDIVGVTQVTISRLELGRGGSLSLDVWQRAFAALDRQLVLNATRDQLEQPADAGHLQIQELLLRLGRRVGYKGSFELATRPAEPSRSVDVGLRDDRRRRLVLVECWNTIGDVGAAVRSTNRKLAEAAQLAVAIGGDRPYAVAACWVVRATTRNRALVARYPEVFVAKFPGSSLGWVRALSQRTEAPPETGLLWCDVAATRVCAWRRSK